MKRSRVANPLKTVHRVLIVHRDSSRESLKILKQVQIFFKKHKIQTKAFLESACKKKYFKEIKPDLVLVLGGDGTYLKAVQCAEPAPVPFLGINMGSFGFLTVHRQKQIIPCLQNTLKGKMQVEQRALIDIKVQKAGQTLKKYRALNDLVLERGGLSRLIQISISIDKQNIYSFKADGVILSTPTGSTAYNLAAGGPILHPQVGAFALTPICSHSLTGRPVIVPDTCALSFEVRNKNQSAFLTVDGKKRVQITNKDQVIVQKSSYVHKTLRHFKHNYFLLLKDKLKFSR